MILKIIKLKSILFNSIHFFSAYIDKFNSEKILKLIFSLIFLIILSYPSFSENLTKENYINNKLKQFLSYDQEFFDSEVDIRNCIVQLNSWSNKLRKSLSQASSQLDSVTVVNKFIYSNIEIKFSNKSILLSDIFLHKKGNCLTIAILHLLLAEKLNMQLFAIPVPEHFFIRYYSSNTTYINMEPTRNGRTYTDLSIINYLKISSSSISKGVYMVKKSLNELLPYYLNNLGAIYYYESKYLAAKNLYNISLQIDAKQPITYYNRGNVYFDLGYYLLSIKDYNSAIYYGLHKHEVYFKKGVANYNRGNKEEACKGWEIAAILGNKKAKKLKLSKCD